MIESGEFLNYLTELGFSSVISQVRYNPLVIAKGQIYPSKSLFLAFYYYS